MEAHIMEATHMSTKDIGVVKIVEGSKKTYNGRNEKATVIFKKGGKSE